MGDGGLFEAGRSFEHLHGTYKAEQIHTCWTRSCSTCRLIILVFEMNIDRMFCSFFSTGNCEDNSTATVMFVVQLQWFKRRVFIQNCHLEVMTASLVRKEQWPESSSCPFQCDLKSKLYFSLKLQS